MFFSNVIKYEVVEKEINFLVTEIIIAGEQIKVGAVYVPPTSTPPLHLSTFSRNINKKHSYFLEIIMQSTLFRIVRKIIKVAMNYLIGSSNEV